MSKRHKPTIADRYYVRTAKDAESMAEETERLALAGDFYATLSLRAGEVDSTLEMLGLWERCRHVFRFDRVVTEALDATDSPGGMPAEELACLPYDIIFIEAPFTIHHTLEGDAEISGAFVWRSESDGDACVKVRCVRPDLAQSVTHTVPVARRTLGEAASEITSRLMRDFARVSVRTGTAYEVQDHLSQSVLEILTHITNHVLYLNSEQFDDEVVYEPSGRMSPKRARTQSQSVVHATGIRAGRLLREAWGSRPSGRASATGAHVRPHIRRGHWKRFLCGPRDRPDEQYYRIRWVKPILVNAGKGDPIRDTYIHDDGLTR